MNKTILNKIVQRRREEKCRFFTPNGKIEQFIRAIGQGKHQIYILSAGNGIGKTGGVMNIVANIVYGPQNDWFRYPLYEKWPYPKRIRVVTESKNVEEIGAIDQEIKTWWPKGRYRGFKDGKNYLCRYEMDGDWIMDKMTYEQEEKEFESSTLGAVVFDEPPPRSIFYACKMRLRMGGIMIIPMTPLGGAGWLFDEIIDNPSEDTFILFGDTEDACKVHGVRGHLEHEHIERIFKDMDPSEIAARKEGRPLQSLNSIFGQSLVREVHIIPDETEPPHGSQFGITVDPADGKPYAFALWWCDPRGHIVIDREYPEDDWLKLLKTKPQLPTMQDYSRIFREYTKDKPMEWWLMDRHFGNNRNVLTGKTLIDDWSNLFQIDFSQSYNVENEMSVGILKVNEYLKFNKAQPINAMNMPRLYVKERCKNTWRSLEKWARKVDPLRFVAAPDRDSPWKDFCDVVRYTVMRQPEVYVSKPFQQQTAGKYAVGR
mgnify:CR=1 FL=1